MKNAGTGLSADKAPDYDVVIVGGGMVGSMLAAALATKTTLKVAVLENQLPEPMAAGTDEPYDIRVSALSIASQRMLENVDAWQGILNRRACPYEQMLVWDGETTGRTHFRASEIGATALGHIVENRVIQLALLDVLTVSEAVDYRCPSRLLSFQPTADRIVCELDDESDHENTSITTRLLVGADGAQSIVRELAGIQIQRSSYPQHALVASVETVLPQQDITWQRFQPTGPEAMLPLCGHRASMVWYHTEEEVQRLKALSDEAFIAALEQTFPEQLGGIQRVLARGSFPIAKAHAKRYMAQRIALVGDAAHTVHPLAGQGVNLGLLDAAALADVIIGAIEQNRDIGAHRVLRQYERWRRGDNAMMISVLDGFYHAFKPQPQAVQTIRSTALNIADNAALLKRFVMRYAMGTAGNLPTLAR